MKTPDEIKKGLQEAPHVKYFADDPSSADGRDVRYGVVIGYVLREELVALIERLAQAEEDIKHLLIISYNQRSCTYCRRYPNECDLCETDAEWRGIKETTK